MGWRQTTLAAGATNGLCPTRPVKRRSGYDQMWQRAQGKGGSTEAKTDGFGMPVGAGHKIVESLGLRGCFVFFCHDLRLAVRLKIPTKCGNEMTARLSDRRGKNEIYCLSLN